MLNAIARYGLARGASGLVNFLALVIFTRLVDQGEYGRYALVLAGVTIAQSLLVNWLNLGVLRLAAQHSAQRETFLATVGRLFLLLVGLTAILMSVGVGASVGWQNRPLIVVAAILLITQAWYDLNLALVSADRQPGRYAVLSVTRALTGLTCGVAAAELGMGAFGLLSAVALGTLLSGGLAYRLSWRNAAGAPSDAHLRSELFHYGIPLAGAYVLGYIISAGDRFLLGIMMSPEAAGVYAPAYDLVAQSMSVLLMVVNLAAFPAAVAAVDSSDSDTQQLQLKEHCAILLSLALPAGAGLAVLAPSVSEVLGPRFAPTARVLIPTLAVGAVLSGLKSYYLDLSFQLKRQTRSQAVTVAVGAIVNVGLNLLLIPIYGVVGAAYATVGAFAVAACLSWWLGRRILRMPIPGRALLRTSAATGGMSLVLLAVRDARGPVAIFGQVTLGILAYGGLMALFAKGRLRAVFAP